MTCLATPSVLLRQPQLANNTMEETNARTSSGELDAGVCTIKGHSGEIPALSSVMVVTRRSS